VVVICEQKEEGSAVNAEEGPPFRLSTLALTMAASFASEA
jgi:hypothetical protein